MVMNKNVWVHGHDQRSQTAIIEFVTLLKTYMPEDHAYIQRSAFIYSNYLSGLYNLPATPKISTKTSLRPIWSGQSVYNSSLRSLGSEEQEEELATSFYWDSLCLAHLHCSADQLLWQVQEEKREEHRDGVRAMWSVWFRQMANICQKLCQSWKAKPIIGHQINTTECYTGPMLTLLA